MEEFRSYELQESFERFERAAAKGHEESIWIVSVVKDVEMEMNALIETFAKTEEPFGWWFAGRLSGGREQFDFYKKSAEGGCSWGQVTYGWYFNEGRFVEKDQKVFVEWLEKAANQNNPMAMDWLGYWFRWEEGDDKEKAVSYCRAGAELGWKRSMDSLARMLRDGEGCEKDLRQAVIWSAKGDSNVFWNPLADPKGALGSGATESLGCDFNQLCYSLGWGLYWYQYGSEDWNEQDDKEQVFGNRCLEFYCSCVECN
jgi:TPR repeat protein